MIFDTLLRFSRIGYSKSILVTQKGDQEQKKNNKIHSIKMIDGILNELFQVQNFHRSTCQISFDKKSACQLKYLKKCYAYILHRISLCF